MSERLIQKTVYFVRRGESADNVLPVFQSPDSPLNERGRQQAEKIAERVARADEALAFLSERQEKILAVVTHGYFVRTIIARVLLGDLLSGEAFRRIQKLVSMENTGRSVLRHHGGAGGEASWRPWTYNDHAHLG